MRDKVNAQYRFLGITVHALTKRDILEVIGSAVNSQANNLILGNHNLHSLYLSKRNESMRRFYALNRFTHIDGMSLVMLGRLLGHPLKRMHRAAYLDWFEDFLRIAQEQSWRVYFLGGTAAVAEGVREQIRRQYPGLEFNSHHGYDAFAPDTRVYEDIKQFAPHVLLVGMGMPLQESWILQAVEKLNVNVLLPCGGIMDFRMGVQKAAPRWIGQIGMEWLFRLVHSPRKLFRRYILEPIAIFPFVLEELMKTKDNATKVREIWLSGERKIPGSQPVRAVVESSAECS